MYIVKILLELEFFIMFPEKVIMIGLDLSRRAPVEFRRAPLNWDKQFCSVVYTVRYTFKYGKV